MKHPWIVVGCLGIAAAVVFTALFAARDPLADRQPGPVPPAKEGALEMSPGATDAAKQDRHARQRAPSPPPSGGRPGLTGTILDPIDAPIPGAEVRALREAESGFDAGGGTGEVARAKTGRDGRFELELPGAASYLLVFHHPEFARRRALRHLWVEPDRMTDLGVLRMEAGLALRGVVLDEHANLVTEARVDLEAELQPDLGPFAPEPRRRLTDGRGMFVFAGLAPGTYRLTVRPGGTRLARHRLHDVRARPPSAEPLEIRLQRAHRIEGTLVDARGVPARDALIELTPLAGNHGVSRPTRTDQAGRFELHGLAPGLYRLLAGADSSPASPTATRTVSVPADAGLRVELPPGRSLRAVLVSDGAPLPARVSVQLHLPDATPQGPALPAGDPIPVTLDGPELRLPGLAEGIYEIEVRAEGFAPARARLRTESLLEIRMRRQATLEGTLRRPAGEPVGGLELLALDRGFPWDRTAGLEGLLPVFDAAILGRGRTDAAGAFRLSGLRAAEFTLVPVRSPGWVLASGRLGAGETTRLELDWRPEPGELVVEQASPAAGSRLEIWSLEAPWLRRWRTFPADGVLHFKTLPPGRYGLRLLEGSPAEIVEVFAGMAVRAVVP